MNVLRNATKAQLEQAEAALHREIFSLLTTSQDGEIIEKNGLHYTYSTNGPQPGGMVVCPVMKAEEAGELLDEMMAFYAKHKATGIGAYSLYPSQPADLGIRLLARGFQPGWWPGWMGLDMDTANFVRSIPADVEIKPDNFTSTYEEKDLPYFGNHGIITDKMQQAYPERTQRFLAFRDGKIIGQSAVCLMKEDNAVAGIFNVGVVPEHRRQNIGRSLVLAACKWAHDRGYQYALLNATGRRMYLECGFEYIGNGRTWWLQSDKYFTDPPSAHLVQLAEAVGRGDTKTMDKLASRFTPDELSKPISNGMTLVELAIHCHQPASAIWLDYHGVLLRPYEAWRLGWKERAAELLQQDPSTVNYVYGHMDQTLLHYAAEHNDMELAKLALTANPDLTLCDRVYKATALGWAQHFGRTSLIVLLQKN